MASSGVANTGMASSGGCGPKTAPLVFIVAGEPSGDLLGARLMAALREETGGHIRFAGVGGEGMAAQGLHSLVPIEELSVMGLVEVLPHLFKILGHIRQTAAAARSLNPALVLTIDAPNFSLEISKRLAGLGVPRVHYVAPSVWAWKARRAERIARFLDHLLVLLPFEPPYFEKHGLATTFVGHPAVEDTRPPGAGSALRERHGIPPEARLIAVLPGSRRGEVKRLSPIFAAALGQLKARFPDLHVLVPTLSGVAEMVRAHSGNWPLPVTVLTGPDDKREAFAAAEVALAASGTVAVELAVAGVPAVIAYRLAPLTAMIAHRLIKAPYASIPNLLLNREVQPELLTDDCTPDNLAAAVGVLLADPAAREAQKAAYREVVGMLTPGGDTPSRRAARKLLKLIGG